MELVDTVYECRGNCNMGGCVAVLAFLPKVRSCVFQIWLVQDELGCSTEDDTLKGLYYSVLFLERRCFEIFVFNL